MNQQEKLSIWRKIGYGLGEAGSQFSFSMITSYLTVFYTDVVGLTPVVISVIMLTARIWDALNDPIFGAIAENTSSKWGRFRPYILFGAPILAIFNCIVFWDLNVSPVGKVIWCCCTYIGSGMAYTVVNISVGCLANSITAINRERVSLNAVKGILSGVTGIIMNAATMPMILYFGNQSTSSTKGYFMAALIYSLIALPCFWLCVYSTKETVQPKRVQKRQNVLRALLRSFQYVMSDRNAVFLILAMMFFLTGLFGRLGIMAYYFIYVLRNPLLAASAGTAMTVGAIVVNFYSPLLLNRVDKKWVGVFAALCQAACCIAFFYFGEVREVVPVVVISFVYGATNIVPLVSTALGAEIIDDNWIRTGIRSDGIIFSCISFSTKLGNAVGGSVGIVILGMVGFVANTEMSSAVLTRMNMVINIGPILFFVISAILFALNGMTNEKGRENEKKIKALNSEK